MMNEQKRLRLELLVASGSLAEKIKYWLEQNPGQYIIGQNNGLYVVREPMTDFDSNAASSTGQYETVKKFFEQWNQDFLAKRKYVGVSRIPADLMSPQTLSVSFTSPIVSGIGEVSTSIEIIEGLSAIRVDSIVLVDKKTRVLDPKYHAVKKATLEDITKFNKFLEHV